MKVVTATESEVPSRAEVAAASRPKKAIVAEMKRYEKEKAGKVYVPSKHDAAPYKTINWMSPTFWPIIETAARQQIGKPNLSKLAAKLKEQDPRFEHFDYRRLSDWRDKSVKDRLVWSKETIAAVKKEFLPGGHQTRFNVFVSALQSFMIQGSYNRDFHSTTTLEYCQRSRQL